MGSISTPTKSPSAVLPAQRLVRSESRQGAGVRPMAVGRVRWFNDRRGYGFIQMNDSEAEVFVHHSAIVDQGFRTLVAGQQVQFDLEYGRKGMIARNVQKVRLQ